MTYGMHVEDAEPFVKAFSICKIILTTRMNDINQHIPSNESIDIGPMTQNEAVSLLTFGVIDISQLLREDVSLLHELAQDVHLWPLLLSLVRGHIFHNFKQYHLPYQEVVQKVRLNLRQRGLPGFDKNMDITKSRKLAVQVCIEATLELLTKSISDKIKTLILCTGIGTSLQTAVLNCLWNVSEQEAKNSVDVLWVYSLVQFTFYDIANLIVRLSCIAWKFMLLLVSTSLNVWTTMKYLHFLHIMENQVPVPLLLWHYHGDFYNHMEGVMHHHQYLF